MDALANKLTGAGGGIKYGEREGGREIDCFELHGHMAIATMMRW